jgi:glycosyltransferase involved in cell wall biosynthesis
MLSPQRVSHPEALQLMRDAHTLLLLRKGPDASSGKIFEYMMAGRPVLVISAKEGVAAQLVRTCGIGCAVDAEDAGELAQVLAWIATDYSTFVDKCYRPAWAEIERMERKRLTGELAQLLDEVVATRTHSK